MSDTTADLLVLGLGNVLLGDDAVGPAAITVLRKSFVVPGGVRCLDGGTLGLSLLPYLEDARTVILVDAVMADGPPGTLVRLAGRDVGPAVATKLSPHQVGVADLLQGARWHDREPVRLVLLGIVPESIELGVGLSQPVAASMRDLVDMICAEAAACGYPLGSMSEVAAAATFDIATMSEVAPAATFDVATMSEVAPAATFDIARWLEGPRA